ncbi:MAG: hypothetical protein NVSMB22_26780 [Chloroflexota bacterium]
MTSDTILPFDHRVLDAVRHLTADSSTGVDPHGVIARIATGEDGTAVTVESDFVHAVARLRQDGLLMSNPSGHLRLTSAGQRMMVDTDPAAQTHLSHEV